MWYHTLHDLQLDTSAGWAALPLAVRMPTCSSPPCAPDMKRRQDLSSPRNGVWYMCVGPALIFPAYRESYAGYLAPCGGLGSNGATMASPFFPEFPGSEHWPRVRGHTADV